MARIRTIKPYRKAAITAADRRAIATRYGCKVGKTVPAACIYCGCPGFISWVAQERGPGWVQFKNLEIEHKLPELAGGLGGDNLDVACLPCNRAKGARTLDQWKAANP